MENNTLAKNYDAVLSKIPSHVTLVAVSKTHSAQTIKQLYDLGQKLFGENKVQELQEKQPLLPKDIQWHLIGHLQTNKVKYIAPYISFIESVESLKLLKEINKQASVNSRIIDILLQIRIAEEETKTGLQISELEEILEIIRSNELQNIRFRGFMGIGTFTDDVTITKKEFQNLKKLYDTYSEEFNLDTLSMGMSGDFELAIAEGSNSVRVGSAIFGSR